MTWCRVIFVNWSDLPILHIMLRVSPGYYVTSSSSHASPFPVGNFYVSHHFKTMNFIQNSFQIFSDCSSGIYVVQQNCVNGSEYHYLRWKSLLCGNGASEMTDPPALICCQVMVSFPVCWSRGIHITSNI